MRSAFHAHYVRTHILSGDIGAIYDFVWKEGKRDERDLSHSLSRSEVQRTFEQTGAFVGKAHALLKAINDTSLGVAIHNHNN